MARRRPIVGRQSRDRAQWQFDGRPHGGFYTQDDVREIVAYAQARFVTVVPEIEMPGHAMAAIAAYPELGVTGEPVEVATTWGVFDDILNADGRDRSVPAERARARCSTLFPARYIHIGGDEADKAQWKASPAVQARIKELGAAGRSTSCRAGSSARWTRSSPRRGGG